MNKQKILSGIQPSGHMHIGAYLGSLKNWVELQYNFDSYFCIVDLHAITVPQDPIALQQQTLELAKIYISAGIDTTHSKIFVQSHIHEHAELGWILNCFTQLGELEKMTQFKDKTSQGKRPNAGLFTYPVLMSADILLYQANLVPVGQDQTQHIELTRNIAHRINNKYNKQIFTIPECYIPKEGARIKGLQNPNIKMSKSTTNKNDILYLLDDEQTIKNKISKAITDTDTQIKFDEETKPGISNLLNILSGLIETTIENLEDEFKNTSYGAFKQKVASIINEKLLPIREKYNSLDDKTVLEELKNGKEQAQKIAKQTLDEVKDLIGFLKQY